MFSRKRDSYNNPIENYLREVRLISLFNGYNLANGVVDQFFSKEVLKEEMRRIEEYLASKEEMTLTRRLK